MSSENDHPDLPETGSGGARRSHARHERSVRTPDAYEFADLATEAVVYLMVVFSVWAFASIPAWAVWIMNVCGYFLGLLLVIKWVTRWPMGYVPSRWDAGANRWPTRLLAALTVVLVGWCFVSALNARAVVNIAESRFEYRDHFIPWLPHSYDAPSSWFAAWQYLGLACSFWAIRDWLLGKTRHERHHARDEESFTPSACSRLVGGRCDRRGSERFAVDWTVGDPFVLPARLQRLLWVICLNGALVAIEGVLQRLSGTNKLLWLMEPLNPMYRSGPAQFGPFDYRSNAAQYLNLIWPVCLAFWWQLRHASKLGSRRESLSGGSPHVLLVPAVLVIFTAAVFAGSRGGALMAGGLFVVSAAILVVGGDAQTRKIGLGIVAALALVSAGGAALGGWQALSRLLAPPQFFKPGVKDGLSDLTVHCVIDCPTQGIPRWWQMAYLAPAPGESDRIAAVLYIYRDGLGFFLRGNPATNQFWLACTNFIPEFGGRRIGITAIKEGAKLALYADGHLLSLVTNQSRPNLLTNRVGSAFFRIQRDRVSSGDTETATLRHVRLYAGALPPPQVSLLTNLLHDLAGTQAEGQDLPAPLIDITRRNMTALSPVESQLSGRSEIYEVGRQMALDFPWFGSGPGTFVPLYTIYQREAGPERRLPVHDDWLETRITLGRVGSGLVCLALAAAVLPVLARVRRLSSSVYVPLLAGALGGCLLHARFDYPLQVYSILFLFLVLLTSGTVVSARKHP